MRLFVFCLILCRPLFGGLSLTLEQGPVWQSRNEFGISGASGTRVDIARYDAGPFYTGRIEGRYHFSPFHSVRLLIAPFTNNTAFRTDSSFQFQDTTFSAGQLLRATFTFNSYRASYIYTFNPDSEDWVFELGVTAKVRHAKIAVSDGVTTAEKPDFGFVPLLHFEITRKFSPQWSLSLGGDALAAPQGRAEDLLLKAQYQLTPQWNVYAGYRMLEGGADNSAVYTFSWFHSAVVGLELIS